MDQINQTILPEELGGTEISEEKLRGQQSIRTTFRLPVELIDLLGIVAAQFGLKQKALFDQLIEDVNNLQRLAESPMENSQEGTRRAKTYVVSKKALYVLDKVAKAKRIPRDVLVELAVARLLPVVAAELEKHKKRERLLFAMAEYLSQGRNLMDQTESLLGANDHVYEMVSKLVCLGEEKVDNIKRIVARGKRMEQVTLEGLIGRLVDGVKL